jgi:hypothetical protein
VKLSEASSTGALQRQTGGRSYKLPRIDIRYLAVTPQEALKVCVSNSLNSQFTHFDFCNSYR